jgi:hypothetical protein
LVAIAAIAFRQNQQTTRAELVLLLNCWQILNWLRPRLKRAFTFAYADGDMDAATTQRLIDCFEVWSD